MTDFRQQNIVSDIPGTALATDPDAINTWGVVPVGKEQVWVTINNTPSFLKLYNSKGHVLESFPTPDNPTGLAAVPHVRPGGASLIFGTEGGLIVAFVPGLSNPIVTKFTSPPGSGSVYKGVTIFNNLLYAANFGTAKVDVFDISGTVYKLLRSISDDGLAAVGYAPFNVYADRDRLFVSYALQDGAKHDDVQGPGNGYINLYVGDKVTRLVSRGPLNSPWGLLRHEGKLYVGNFGGGGIINIYDFVKLDCDGRFDYEATFATTVTTKQGGTIQNDGLWAIAVDKVVGGFNIWFAAGSQQENHGLVGILYGERKECP